MIETVPNPFYVPTVSSITGNPWANTNSANFTLDSTSPFSYGTPSSSVSSYLTNSGLSFNPTVSVPTTVGLAMGNDTITGTDNTVIPTFTVDTSNQRYANINDLTRPPVWQQWGQAAQSVGGLVKATASNATSGIRNSWGQMSTGEKFTTGLKAVGSILEALNARKAHKLAKQTLAHNIMNNNRNYEMQRKAWNNTLEERQRYRNAYWEANHKGQVLLDLKVLVII